MKFQKKKRCGYFLGKSFRGLWRPVSHHGLFFTVIYVSCIFGLPRGIELQKNRGGSVAGFWWEGWDLSPNAVRPQLFRTP